MQLYIPLAITLHCIVFIAVVLYFIVPQIPIPYLPQERGVVFGSFRWYMSAQRHDTTDHLEYRSVDKTQLSTV